MKIRTHGNKHIKPSSPEKYACKCKQCGCIFEFYGNECKLDHTERHVLTNRPARYIRCPECNLRNYEWYWSKCLTDECMCGPETKKEQA